MTQHITPGLARRGLLTGGGATLLGAAVLSGPAAHAAPDPSPGPAAPPVGRPHTLTRVRASTPQRPGWTYVGAGFFDFTPEGQTSQRVWGGNGVYTATSSSVLWTGIPVPQGAIIRQLEWTVSNNSGSAVQLLGRLGLPGVGHLGTAVADASAPSGGGLQTITAAVPAANAGPFPSVANVFAGVLTPTSGTVQVNAFRVAFELPATTRPVQVLPAPLRLLDTRGRRKGALGPLTVPGSIGAGTARAAIVNLSVTKPAKSGRITAYAADRSRPGVVQLAYAKGGAAAGELVVPLSAAGGFRLWLSAPARVQVDLVGVTR